MPCNDINHPHRVYRTPQKKVLLNNIELISLLIGQCKSVKSSVLVAEDLLKIDGRRSVCIR